MIKDPKNLFSQSEYIGSDDRIEERFVYIRQKNTHKSPYWPGVNPFRLPFFSIRLGLFTKEWRKSLGKMLIVI